MKDDTPYWLVLGTIVVAIIICIVAVKALDNRDKEIASLNERNQALIAALHNANRPRPLGAFNLVCYIEEER